MSYFRKAGVVLPAGVNKTLTRCFHAPEGASRWRYGVLSINRWNRQHVLRLFGLAWISSATSNPMGCNQPLGGAPDVRIVKIPAASVE